MSADFEPEMGQMIFGNAWGDFDAGNIGRACVQHVLAEIARVYWNTHQREWDEYADPEIRGVSFRPYYWGDCDCGHEEQHSETCSVVMPNLKVDGDDVEIRWYKHALRGLTSNISLSPERWHTWLNLAIKTIQAADVTL